MDVTSSSHISLSALLYLSSSSSSSSSSSTEPTRPYISYQLLDDDVTHYLQQLHISLSLLDPQYRLLSSLSLTLHHSDTVETLIQAIRRELSLHPLSDSQLKIYKGRRKKENTTLDTNNNGSPSPNGEDEDDDTLFEDIWDSFDQHTHPIRITLFPQEDFRSSSRILSLSTPLKDILTSISSCRAEVFFFSLFSLEPFCSFSPLLYFPF